MTPCFYSVHTQWPLFSTFVSNFTKKIAIFCALHAHFEKFNDFVSILTESLQILPWNCIFAHWMTPILMSPHQKSPHFFLVPKPNDPLFQRNLTLNVPGRHLYVTFIFESPPGPNFKKFDQFAFKVGSHDFHRNLINRLSSLWAFISFIWSRIHLKYY